MEYPLSAIETRAELEAILRRAQHAPIKVYSVIPWGTPPLAPILIDGGSHIGTLDLGTGNYILYVTKVPPYQIDRVILDSVNLGDSCGRTGFIFLNYWHAYAHLLKVNNMSDGHNEGV